MKINIDELPAYVKLEISKEDLLAFAEKVWGAREAPVGEPTDELLNFEQMCDFLGIAQSTGYQRVGRGEIPHFKKGRRLIPLDPPLRLRHPAGKPATGKTPDPPARQQTR